MNASETSLARRHIGAMPLPLELAFIRWSVVHRRWHETANDMPLLQAFLAGWNCRCIGASQPQEIGDFRASFLAGWREADEQIVIASRQIERGPVSTPGGDEPASQMTDTQILDWVQKNLVTYHGGIKADGRLDADELAAGLTENAGDLRKTIISLARKVS